MKIHHLVTVCFLFLILLSPAGAAAAPDSPLRFEQNFLLYSDDMGDDPWWQSHILVDDSGRLHATFYTDVAVWYATCNENCGDTASWVKADMFPLGDYSSLGYPSLSLDSAGRPRLMWYDDPNYVYAECSANCSQPGSWKTVEIPLDPDNFYKYPRDARYFTLDDQDRPRFVSFYYDGLTYAYCDSACTLLANWEYSELDFGTVNSLDAMQLALHGDQVSVVGTEDDSSLIYAQCDQDCAAFENWKWLKIAEDVGNILNTPTYSLRLDAQGRPRLAFYRYLLGDKNMYYAWSDSGFTNPGSWTIDKLPLPPTTDRTLDMAIDSQGRPHIVFVSEETDLCYIRCTAGCNTLDSDWLIQDVETDEDLDAYEYLPPDPGFFTAFWMIDGYPSLALLGDNSPVITYYVRNVQYYDTSPANRVWAIRFAGAQAYDYAVYVPLLVR